MNPTYPQKKTQAPDPRSSGQADVELTTTQSVNSDANILQLQHTIGNQATIQHLKRQTIDTPKPSISAHGKPLSLPPLESAESNLMPHETAVVQRRIEPLEGASSGWFRKGRRDKINVLVAAYNRLDAAASGPRAAKPTAQSVQTLIIEIQKVWAAANAWCVDVLKKDPEKAASIRSWIVENVEAEEDRKKAQVGEIQALEALLSPPYNPTYAVPEYMLAELGAADRWLSTPELAPIFEYYVKISQEDIQLEAYKEIKQYALNPSRAEAIRLYDKYKMHGVEILNITGESIGRGGKDAVTASQATLAAVRANAHAPVPPNFGAIERSMMMVIRSIFINFTSTETFRKMTTAPKA